MAPVRGVPPTHVEGRHNEPTMNAWALRADEGRGIAPICAGEPLAGCDPAMSEWGNPRLFPGAPGRSGRAPGQLKHLSSRRKSERPP